VAKKINPGGVPVFMVPDNSLEHLDGLQIVFYMIRVENARGERK